MVGFVIVIILSRPHLVLSHLGGDNRITFGQLVQFFNNILRFDNVGLFIGQRLSVFPAINLIQPFFSLFLDRYLTVEMPIEEAAGQMGVMTVDENWRVIAFDEKPAKPNPIPGKPGICLASMGNYIFNTEFLYEQVIKDADTPGTQHDFGRNIIPAIIDDYRVYAYRFRDPETSEQAYWRDVGTLDAFWEANMELVSVTPQLNLYDDRWPIFTYQWQAPPAKWLAEITNPPDSGDNQQRSNNMKTTKTLISAAIFTPSARSSTR